MDWLSVLIGPVLGTVGSIVGKEQDRKAKKLEYEFEAKKFEHEIALRAQERVAAQEANEQAMALNHAVTESDLAKTIVTGSYDGLRASMEADAGYKPAQWVDNIRALVRPGLTVTTGIIVGVLCYTTGGSIQESAASTIMTQFGMAMAWWFGDRPTGQFKTKWQK